MADCNTGYIIQDICLDKIFIICCLREHIHEFLLFFLQEIHLFLAYSNPGKLSKAATPNNLYKTRVTSKITLRSLLEGSQSYLYLFSSANTLLLILLSNLFKTSPVNNLTPMAEMGKGKESDACLLYWFLFLLNSVTLEIS